MRLVDLTQPWGAQMPTWPQFEPIEVKAIHSHHRHAKSTLSVKLNMHTGTHLDAPIHYWPTGKHLGQIPLEDLVGTGLVIDLSPLCRPWTLYTLEQVLQAAPEPIREGDIVVLYTGWHRYNWAEGSPDEVCYFDKHPGPHPEVIDELVSKRAKWIGTDTPSLDHSLDTAIRAMRPDLVEEYEVLTGQPIEATLPRKWLEYSHVTTAKANIPLVENLAGDIRQVLGRRVTLGAFPWRWEGGEACVCRVVAFLDEG